MKKPGELIYVLYIYQRGEGSLSSSRSLVIRDKKCRSQTNELNSTYNHSAIYRTELTELAYVIFYLLASQLCDYLVVGINKFTPCLNTLLVASPITGVYHQSINIPLMLLLLIFYCRFDLPTCQKQ